VLNVLAKEKSVIPFPKQKTFAVDWDSLPLLLTPHILYEALPPGVLGRDHIYGLWELKNFPGKKLGNRKIVGKDALRAWLNNPGA